MAAEAAISNPLLDDVTMRGARGVLINITGGMDMTLFEVDEAANQFVKKLIRKLILSSVRLLMKILMVLFGFQLSQRGLKLPMVKTVLAINVTPLNKRLSAKPNLFQP